MKSVTARASLLVLLSLVVTQCDWMEEEIRRPSRYILQDGYVGWVEVEYNAEGAPPLPIEDGFYAVEIDRSGYAATSTPIDYGVPLRAGDEFIYRHSDVKISLGAAKSTVGVWHEIVGTKIQYGGSASQRGRSLLNFFVGTEEDWMSWKEQWEVSCRGSETDCWSSFPIGPLN